MIAGFGFGKTSLLGFYLALAVFIFGVLNRDILFEATVFSVVFHHVFRAPGLHWHDLNSALIEYRQSSTAETFGLP